MKTLIFLTIIFCLLCSLVSSAQQDTTRRFTGVRNTPAAILFIDKGKEIGRLTSTSLTGKDSTGTVFIKSSRTWYIADTTRSLQVLMRMTELSFNIKQ